MIKENERGEIFLRQARKPQQLLKSVLARFEFEHETDKFKRRDDAPIWTES